MSVAPRWGGKKAWDHVERRLAPEPTSVPAGMTPRERLEGIEVVGQQPAWPAEEVAYWQETGQERALPRWRLPAGASWLAATLSCIAWVIKSGQRAPARWCSSSPRRGIFPKPTMPLTMGRARWRDPAAWRAWATTGAARGKARGIARGRARGGVEMPWLQSCGGTIRRAAAPSRSGAVLERPSRCGPCPKSGAGNATGAHAWAWSTSPQGCPPFAAHRCVAVGEGPRAGDLEVSVGLGKLACVCPAGDGLGGGSGAPGGSGQTPLPLELRSAVAGPAGPRFGVALSKMCVRQGREPLRTEVPHHSPGSGGCPLTVRRLAVGTGPPM
jgi:hypothetical protein